MNSIIFLFVLSVLVQEFLVSSCYFIGRRNNSGKDARNNPDFYLSTAGMIRRAGYSVVSYTIMTEDSYILTIHRIPGPQGSSPVLLQHGLFSSSDDWVVTGQSLGYMLADRGYDVWFGNIRGNTYGRAHETMSIANPKFWDFSFHEIGTYDVPAIIKFIFKMTKSSLTYIGHSMGTTSFYIMASTRPDIFEQKMVRNMYSLAPVAFMSHLKSPLRLLAPFVNEFEMLAKLLGANELLPQSTLTRFLARYGCDLDTTEENVCENIMFVIGGFDGAQINITTVPIILSHTPAGASTKTVIHYLQEINSGKFRQFDYGNKENIKNYNSTEPPEYDLTKVMVPVTLIYGDNDWLAGVKDVEKLYDELPGPKTMMRVDLPKWNHYDFLYGKDAPRLLYEKIIDSMKSFDDLQKINRNTID